MQRAAGRLAAIAVVLATCGLLLVGTGLHSYSKRIVLESELDRALAMRRASLHMRGPGDAVGARAKALLRAPVLVRSQKTAAARPRAMSKLDEALLMRAQRMGSKMNTTKQGLKARLQKKGILDKAKDLVKNVVDKGKDIVKNVVDKGKDIVADTMDDGNPFNDSNKNAGDKTTGSGNPSSNSNKNAGDKTTGSGSASGSGSGSGSGDGSDSPEATTGDPYVPTSDEYTEGHQQDTNFLIHDRHSCHDGQSGQGEPCSGGWEFLAGDYAPSPQGFNTDPAATIDGPAADMTSIYNYGHDDYEGTVTD